MSKEDKDSGSLKSLDDHGIYLICDDINDKTASDIIRFILEANLDPKCNWKRILLIINSAGGSFEDGMAIIDIMAGSKIPIYTIGIGQLCSMGLVVFLAGKKGYRKLTSNCVIMSHQWSWGYGGKQHELVASEKAVRDIQSIMMLHYKNTTGLTKKQILKYLLPPHDVYLTAEEACELGVCDEVITLIP